MLRDPDLAFNVSVMRAADKERATRLAGEFKQLRESDQFGVGRVIAVLSHLFVER